MAKSPSGGIDDAAVRKLADLLEETGLSEIEYGKDGWHIKVSKAAGPVAASVEGASRPQAPAAPVVEDGAGAPASSGSPPRPPRRSSSCA